MTKTIQAQAHPETAFGSVQYLPYSESEVGLRLANGQSERVLLKLACPTPFIVNEPTVEANGDVKMTLEIHRFELVGKSEVLWPGATIRVLGGAQAIAGAKPIYGFVTIPAGKSIEDGVISEQHLYLHVETPIGVLHNEQPIRMVGELKQIPPLGARFQSQDEVPMYDAEGRTVVTFWGCAQEA